MIEYAKAQKEWNFINAPLGNVIETLNAFSICRERWDVESKLLYLVGNEVWLAVVLSRIIFVK